MGILHNGAYGSHTNTMGQELQSPIERIVLEVTDYDGAYIDLIKSWILNKSVVK